MQRAGMEPEDIPPVGGGQAAGQHANVPPAGGGQVAEQQAYMPTESMPRHHLRWEHMTEQERMVDWERAWQGGKRGRDTRDSAVVAKPTHGTNLGAPAPTACADKDLEIDTLTAQCEDINRTVLHQASQMAHEARRAGEVDRHAADLQARLFRAEGSLLDMSQQTTKSWEDTRLEAEASMKRAIKSFQQQARGALSEALCCFKDIVGAIPQQVPVAAWKRKEQAMAAVERALDETRVEDEYVPEAQLSREPTYEDREVEHEDLGGDQGGREEMEHDRHAEVEEATLGAPTTQPWAALIAKDEKMYKYADKSTFHKVFKSKGTMLPQALCGAQRAEPSPANYFARLMEEGMDSALYTKVAYILMEHHRRAVDKHHTAFEGSYRPDAAKVIVEASRMPVIMGMPATGRTEVRPKAGGTQAEGSGQPKGREAQPAVGRAEAKPTAGGTRAAAARPQPQPTGQLAGRYTGGDKALSVTSESEDEDYMPKEGDVARALNTDAARKKGTQLAQALGKDSTLREDASNKVFKLWEARTAYHAAMFFGPDWKTVTEALVALTTTFRGTLEEDWLNESTTYMDEMGFPWLSQGYPTLIQWIKGKLALEVRDEEMEARQAMLDRTCTQGDQSVTQYVNALRRAVRDIPKVSDKELIVWFLSGLRTGISHYCKCDTKGKPWERYQDLVDHARAKESELNSRRGVHGDTPGKAAPSRFVKTWQKTGGKTNTSLAVARNEPQASKGPWQEVKGKEVSPTGNKRTRFESPPARGGRTSGAGGSGASDKAKGDAPPRKKDWKEELPGEPGEECTRYP